jgi:hypothetical protein
LIQFNLIQFNCQLQGKDEFAVSAQCVKDFRVWHH